MRRIVVHIDRLSLNGFDDIDSDVVRQALGTHLAELLAGGDLSLRSQCVEAAFAPPLRVDRSASSHLLGRQAAAAIVLAVASRREGGSHER